MPLYLLNAPRCPVIVVMELNCLNDNPKKEQPDRRSRPA